MPDLVLEDTKWSELRVLEESRCAHPPCAEKYLEGNTKRVQDRVSGQVAPVILGRSADGPF